MPIATLTTTLVTLAAAKAHLPVKSDNTDQDARIAKLADGVSARIEAMTGRKFVSQSVSEVVDARGNPFFDCRHFPVSAVATLSRRADMQDAWEEFSASDYELESLTGRIWMVSRSFYSGPRTARATYTAGYGAQGAATLPQDLVAACLDWIKFAWTRGENGLIMASSAGMGEANVLVVPEPPKDIRDAVTAHRRIRL